MFRISVCFGDAGTVWAFMFRTKETADQALKVDAGTISISDDFEQSATWPAMAVIGTMIEDMEQSALAHQETMLHNARIQARAQQRAQSDPGLKMAAMSAPIHSPFQNGGLPRG